jgi:hypothetical protein
MIKLILGIGLSWCEALSLWLWSGSHCVLIAALLLCACGGSSSDKSDPSVATSVSSQAQLKSSSFFNSSSSVNSISSVAGVSAAASASASSIKLLQLSGRVSYDFIPHFQASAGLNYAAMNSRPVRGALVEILNSSGAVVAVASTNELGDYSFEVLPNALLQVRVKAQLVSLDDADWNIKVTDNTANNALYSMVGALVTTGLSDSKRDLHAASGWGGSGYSELRVAAPFAILDTLFEGHLRLKSLATALSFTSLQIRWSTKNKAAEGDYTLGEIGTSFFDGQAIYLLGDENNDTDEYDSSVILHEWSHYLEREMSRSDSLGGDHGYGDKLDMRVAMSEGYANAMAGMILNDPLYRDSSSQNQFSGYSFLLNKKDHMTRGWYVESSIESVLYNFYSSSLNKPAADLSPFINVLVAPGYRDAESFVSIFLFAAILRNQVPEQYDLFQSLLLEQNISTTDEYATGESNAGGSPASLPIYKVLSSQGAVANVCSSNQFGTYNKLLNSQFLRLAINSPGSYRLSVIGVDTNDIESDPDILLFKKGGLVAQAEGQSSNREILNSTLTEGTYILEVYDARVKDSEVMEAVKSCFNVSVTLI